MAKTKTDGARLLTLRDITEATGRNDWALREDAEKGRLATIRFSPRGKFYIRPADYEAYLARHRTPSVEEGI